MQFLQPQLKRLVSGIMPAALCAVRGKGSEAAMGKYDKRYNAYLVASVKHIFQTFIGDDKVEEIIETQSAAGDLVGRIEISGAFR
jgi:hypothetical protein